MSLSVAASLFAIVARLAAPAAGAPKDCAKDLECLAKRAETCKSGGAQHTTVLDVDFGGARITTSTLMRLEVAPGKAGCVLHVKPISGDVTTPKEGRRPLPREQLEPYQCEYKDGKRIATVLRAWKRGNFSTADTADATCAGGPFSAKPSGPVLRSTKN